MINRLVQEKTNNPNKIIKALVKDYFPELKKYLIYARYIHKPLKPPIRLLEFDLAYRGLGGKTQFTGFGYIRIDSIIKDAETSVLIGGIAHEFGHAIVNQMSLVESREIEEESDLERVADLMVIKRGLGKYLYEVTNFLENLPPEHYGLPNSYKGRRLGFSTKELNHILGMLPGS